MRKALSLIVTASLVLSLLAGCGTQKDTGSSKTTQKAATQTEQAATTTAPKEPVTITHLSSKVVSKDFMEKLIADFKTETGITVQPDYVAVENYGQVLSTKIAASEAPDTFQVFPSKSGYFLQGEKNMLLDITNETWQADVMDGVKAQMMINGKIYAIATVQHILPVLYNKKLFKQAGIEKLPTTPEEFMDICAKLKTAGITPLTVMGKNNGLFFETFSMAPALVFGKDMEWQRKREAGEVKFQTSEGWKRVFTLLEDMFKKGYFIDKPNTIGYPESINIFCKGKAAMMMLGNWEFTNIQKSGGTDFEFGGFFFPTEAGVPLVYPGSIGDMFSASADTKYPNESKQFLGYFGVKRGEDAAVEFGGLPTTKKADMEKLNPVIKELMPVIQANKSYTFLGNEWPSGFGDFCNQGAQAMMAGKMTVEDILKDADKQFDDKYKLFKSQGNK